MDVHLVDGTYELFRHFFAIPSQLDATGREVAATRGVLQSMVSLLESGATHLGVATDHVIESFRNDLWPGYKTSDGVDPRLLDQFPLLEECLEAMGVRVWPMVELEADDALAAAARRAGEDAAVTRVFVCTPDKDLAQCVRGTRVVQLERRTRKLYDEAGVIAKFGVPPASIPDWLALVGDSSDGYPGLPGWGPQSATILLAHYGRLDAIPREGAAPWEVTARGALRLRQVLVERWEQALLFRRLATLVDDAPVLADVGELRWRGPTAEFEAVCRRLEAPDLLERALRLAARTG